MRSERGEEKKIIVMIQFFLIWAYFGVRFRRVYDRATFSKSLLSMNGRRNKYISFNNAWRKK
jgi:hypothetical protein